MRTFVAATIVMAVIVGYATRGYVPAAHPAPPAATATPAPQPAGPSASVTIQRGLGGHFTVRGDVGGTALDFIVDTGASQVALGREEARRVGLWVSDGDFDGTAQTATTPVRVARRTLPHLRIGAIELADVAVLVIDVPKAMPLLGQSFLGRIDKVAIEGDRMTLTKL